MTIKGNANPGQIMFAEICITFTDGHQKKDHQPFCIDTHQSFEKRILQKYNAPSRKIKSIHVNTLFFLSETVKKHK